jgi:hypothetical protein
VYVGALGALAPADVRELADGVAALRARRSAPALARG